MYEIPKRSHRSSHLSVHGNIKLQWGVLFSKIKRIKYEVRSCIGQQRLSFLSLINTENDIVESITVACREEG